MDRLRTLVGITIFWVVLSLLGDGFSTLVVPARLTELVDPAWAATVIGLVTFLALIAGMIVQPLGGAISDAVYPRFGRRGPLAAATILIIVALGALATARGVGGVLAAFVLLAVAASLAQAAQQGFLPDRIEPRWRGRAAGAKGLADLGGAFLGFLLLGALIANGNTASAVLVVAMLVLATVVATIVLVREPDRQARRAPGFSLAAAYRLDTRAHPAFVQAVAARFFFLLGTFAVGRFFLLFVADRLGLDPAAAGAEAGGILAALTLISA